MTNQSAKIIGTLAAIWRYPIKSMRGEQLNAATVTERGMAGDRSYALVDRETGKVASAKNPRLWPNLFEHIAAYVEEPVAAHGASAVRITLPGGETILTDQSDVEAWLSQSAGRAVTLARSPAAGAMSEGYWPDFDWLDQPDLVFEFPLPEWGFFDAAPIHLVTTSTLNWLRSLAPDSQFDVRRFRPNLVLETPAANEGFIEDGWLGRTLTIGGVTLRLEQPCPRCIMTTLPQAELPKDPAVLRTAVQNNRGNVGVYAVVVTPGRIQRGDSVELL
jgi:uncharacterized protein YcbX